MNVYSGKLAENQKNCLKMKDAYIVIGMEAEIGEELNYNMIDGRKNNGYKTPPAINNMPSQKKPQSGAWQCPLQ